MSHSALLKIPGGNFIRQYWGLWAVVFVCCLVLIAFKSLRWGLNPRKRTSLPRRTSATGLSTLHDDKNAVVEYVLAIELSIPTANYF